MVSQMEVLETLVTYDILVVEERGRESLENLSLLNQYFDVKITTKRSRVDIGKEFA